MGGDLWAIERASANGRAWGGKFRLDMEDAMWIDRLHELANALMYDEITVLEYRNQVIKVLQQCDEKTVLWLAKKTD